MPGGSAATRSDRAGRRSGPSGPAREFSEPASYDSLEEKVHVLLDDIDICVDPGRWVGIVLHPPEVSRSGAGCGVWRPDPMISVTYPDEVCLVDPAGG